MFQVQRDHEEEVHEWGSLGSSNQRLMYEIGSLTVSPPVSNTAIGPKKGCVAFISHQPGGHLFRLKKPGCLSRLNRYEIWRKGRSVRGLGRGGKGWDDRGRGLPSTSRRDNDKSPSGEHTSLGSHDWGRWCRGRPGRLCQCSMCG